MQYRWDNDGFALFRAMLSPGDNRALVTDIATLRDNPGHTLIPCVNGASDIVEDSLVRSVVASVLGDSAEVDLCRHVHENSSDDGQWHQDDYCGQPWPERPRRAILCYFPQDTPIEMGPTQIRSLRGDEVLAAGPAGTCLLMRHDLWHRATANQTNRRRFMLKILFVAGGGGKEHSEFPS